MIPRDTGSRNRGALESADHRHHGAFLITVAPWRVFYGSTAPARAAQTLGTSRTASSGRGTLSIPYIIVRRASEWDSAFVVLIAAELVRRTAGLGYLISDVALQLDGEIFLGMACIGVLVLSTRGYWKRSAVCFKWKYVEHLLAWRFGWYRCDCLRAYLFYALSARRTLAVFASALSRIH